MIYSYLQLIFYAKYFRREKEKIILFQVALGAPCVPAAAPCIPGAVCQSGVCACAPAYVPVADACVRRRKFFVHY